MKKDDVMPGGKYFPIFWFEIFGVLLLVAVIILIVNLVKNPKTPGEVLYPEGGTPGAFAPSGTGVPDNIGPTKLPSERFDTENMQRELLDLYFSAESSYGMEYRGGVLTSDSFAEVFFHGVGKKISAEEVKIGDYAVGDGVAGICVGFYGEFPIYVYMSEYTAAGRDDNGVCMGYSREQNNSLFYGMFPVTYTEYYSVFDKVAEEDIFPSSLTHITVVPWYVNEAFEYGKWFSSESADYLISRMLHEKLSARNLKINRDTFVKYLSSIPYRQGFEGTYDVMVSSVIEKETYTEVTIRFIPHNIPGFKPMGEWKLTFYPEYNKFLPGGIDIAAYSEVGFVREEEIKVEMDENGKVTIEKEEIIYGQTVDEEGNRIFRLEDGTVIYLD